MKLEYHDERADTLYIRFNDALYEYSNELDEFRFLDCDVNGNAIGVELLNVSNGVTLDNLPHQAEIDKILTKRNIKVYACANGYCHCKETGKIWG